LKKKVSILILCLPVWLGFLTTAFKDDNVKWSEEEKDILKSLWIGSLPPLPPDPSNRVSDDPVAASLGYRLFFDTRFSANKKISCATCHKPEKYFTDGLSRSKGTGLSDRHAMSIVGTGYNAWYYWDGRRDKQWSQAITPMETIGEMEGTRVEIVHEFFADSVYRKLYRQLFGSIPSLPNAALRASPRGNDTARVNWQKISPGYQRIYNQVFANIGKAIAAYERTVQYGPSRFDKYAENIITNKKQNSSSGFNSSELRGLKLFISEKAQCLRCHNGPHFTNYGFHKIGLPQLSAEKPDLGRMIGLQAVMMDEFNCAGPYSDAGRMDCTELRFINFDAPTAEAFKVPSLRNVALTAPYMHDGRFTSLKETISHYRTASAALPPGSLEFSKLNLSDKDINDLVAFLKTLSGPVITTTK
jgi:cytochrome c peroxidase